MPVRILPVIAALAPLVGINLAYWIGVNADVIPSCIPYFDGCTSISATGRYLPGSLLFRAVMLPQAVILLVTWYLCALWIRSLAAASKAPRTVLVAGFVGALALIIYVTFLGTKVPIYEFMRRFGIYFYFIGTVVAQLAVSFALLPRLPRHAHLMLVICAVPFVLGILNLVLKSVLADADMAENQIEWIAALAMQAWFFVLYFAWRETGFTLSVRTN
jgi:hypothetical protein